MCEFAVRLCLTFFGPAVLPLRALPFAFSQSVVQCRCCGAAPPGLHGCVQNHKGRAAGKQIIAKS